MMKKTFIYMVVVTLFAASAAFAAPADMAETGQKKCYDASGAEILSCTGTGQDGEKQAGVAWPRVRFTDNSNGTITDNLTGLIWLKDAHCFGTKIWADALTAANGLASGQCGLTDGSKAGDWRLPNVNELESLVHGGYQEETCSGSPCTDSAAWLNTKGFGGTVQAYDYWSSTTYAGNTSRAWEVSMSDGIVFNGNKTLTLLYVWPVRSGQ